MRFPFISLIQSRICVDLDFYQNFSITFALASSIRIKMCEIVRFLFISWKFGFRIILRQ